MLIIKAEQRIQQIINFIKTKRYRELYSLDFEYFETTETYRKPPHDADWVKISTPYEYGKPWHCSWFRASFKTPKSSRRNLYLRVHPNADSLVFIDGKPSGAFNFFHKKIKVNADGKEHVLCVESYAGHRIPGCHPFDEQSVILTIGAGIKDYPNIFSGGALTERIEPVYALYYDAVCLFNLAKTMDDNSLRKAKIIKGLYDALMDIHYSCSADVLEDEAIAAREKIKPLLDAKNGSTAPRIYLTGHAHIDHAWLWHIGETERKAARTYINMIKLMEEYPEFKFIQSQSAQLEIVKKEYPDIFEAVKEAYRKGNWEPNGCMWVEADCNIPGGESLVRQILIGKKAVKEMLNYEGDTLWLPDVFGYSAALPQILSGCRIKYFITSKILWNDTTRFPYDTFLWTGIDGTGIKTHFITSGYNGQVNASDMLDIYNKIQHKEIQSACIKSIGEGDGGGGTARGDLEKARRLTDLEGAPKASWEKVSCALDNIFSENKIWPQWKGELYLELHRGTYTTQSAVKRYNRKLEFTVRNAEFLSALAMLENDTLYPHERLLKNWKKLLTNQFHDIIPGSSIGRVYDEAKKDYRIIEADLTDLCRSVLKDFTGLPSQAGGEYSIRVFNDLSWERNDPVTVPSGLLKGACALKTHDGTVYPVQYYTALDGSKAAVFCPAVPPLGWAALTAAEQTQTSPPFNFNGGSLKTPHYKVTFDEAGRIVSLFDPGRNRELAASDGILNGFVSAQDVPILWEAWDIDADWKHYITEETRLVSSEVITSGPVCFRIRRKYKIGEKSLLIQDTVFYVNTARIDFETFVDWKEKRRLLKVQFDTNISASQIRCEIQYGHLIRGTHQNLPQDRARFEFCAHKWVSLEEEGGGIAILNDCKYGHDAEGGRVRLTLLRSPTAPDPDADQGEHYFTYSLFPFKGSFSESQTVRRGYELNSPAKAAAAKFPARDYSLFWIEGKNVIAETIKAAEPYADNSNMKMIIIRLYESLGGTAEAVLHFNKPLAFAATTDMLEENPKELQLNGKDLYLEFQAFEIKTIAVAFS